MNLIRRFFKKLFRNDPEERVIHSPQPIPNHDSAPIKDDFIARWEKERQERIRIAEVLLKDWMIALVREKGSLPFSWESGNDEAFVTFKDSSDAEEAKFQDLEEYIVDKLDIPDAGEFEMNGNGTIYIEDRFLKVKYTSVMKGLIDYDEENDREIYSEEELDSGDFILFNM